MKIFYERTKLNIVGYSGDILDFQKINIYENDMIFKYAIIS